jgi:nicotinate-nucleotide adenylyltransferase
MGRRTRRVGVTGTDRTGPRAFGILGGTFDPVHLGHLALAREALAALDLDHVLFVPNAEPPHKRTQVITAAHHREAMLTLALASETAFVVSRVELERPGLSYAVETVAGLAARADAEGRPEPWFLLSAEALEGFGAWREPKRILQLCRLAVAPRLGAPPLDVSWVAQHFPGFEDRFSFLTGPKLDIASTDIRKRVTAGAAIDDLAPTEVVHYIKAEGLYRGAAA